MDLALINMCAAGDIVVTQDYGVAAMALGKGAKGGLYWEARERGTSTHGAGDEETKEVLVRLLTVGSENDIIYLREW